MQSLLGRMARLIFISTLIFIATSQLKLTDAQSPCLLCILQCDRDGLNLPRDTPSIKEEMGTYGYAGNSSTSSRISRGIDDHAGDKSTICPYTTQDSQHVLETIDKIVNTFYSKNYQKINMRSDGGVGLAVLKGQLNYLLGIREDKLNHKVRQLLEPMEVKAGALALRILHQGVQVESDPSLKFGGEVMKNNTGILKARFRPWIDKGVIFNHFQEFDGKIGKEKEVVYPYLDFHCLVALVKDCEIPHVCKKMYLEDVYSQYMLMHQVIYQQFAERRSCIQVNQEAFGGESSQEFRDRLCSKAYLEAEFISKNNFPRRFIDLFSEQVGFCGLMGYPNFLRRSWLREILSWYSNSESGCAQSSLYGGMRMTDATIKTDEGEECLIHLTSVSLMALAMHLRYMVDVCNPNIFDVISPHL